MTVLDILKETILPKGKPDDFGFYELPIYDGIKVKNYEQTVRMIHPEEKGGMVFIIDEEGIFVPGGFKIGDKSKVDDVCNSILKYWEVTNLLKNV